MAHPDSAAGANRGRLAIVLGISSTILVAEVVVGLSANSLALLADAGHVFADVVGTSLALAAIWLAARPATRERSFGFYRFEILAAVLNALILFAIAGYVLFEAARRVADAPDVASGPMLIVASGALILNGIAVSLLRAGQQNSLNLRGAYLEVLNDAFGSAAVLVAGLVIQLTGFRQADAIASAVIGLLILPRTWALLREAVDVLLEATPKNVDLATVREHILEAPGVRDVHDLHAWTITSGLNVVSAHVVVDEGATNAAVLDALCRCLSTQFDIAHSTFQLETSDRQPVEEAAHP
ncbi:MAG TPA: cation diffusion facilitator family transporter [Candidatus Limnocylindria bacterium]|nr:cation diffusion facilitator family transporter [Candidatus Limnocylindria bacterium]